MSKSGALSRRNALKMGAMGGLALGFPYLKPALAQEKFPPMASQADMQPFAPGWRRFDFGTVKVTTILDGLRPGEGPFPTFGEDQDADAVGALMAENALPRDQFVNFFNPVVLEIGGETVLVDTGMGEGGRQGGMGLLRERLGAAGYQADRISLVLLTHLHGDHIGGLMEGGAPAFPNARYATGEREMAFWTSDDAKNGPAAGNAKMVETLVVPFKDKMTLLDDGDEVVPGLKAHAAFGHTPGHMVFELTTGNRPLYLMADTFGQFVVAIQRPEWHVRFDSDKEAAAETRKRFLAMLADKEAAFMGYHMPFPALGYIQRQGEGYRFVPDTYQSILGAG